MERISRLTRLLSKLTTKSADHGIERNRRALITAIMNVLTQLVQITTGLVSIPLALNYVGTERFGVWMTMSSALAFITFSDLGVGIGVQDKLTKSIGVNDYQGARQVFYSGFSFVLLLFALIIAISSVIIPRIDLVGMFSLKTPEAIAEIQSTTKMVVFCMALGLLSGVIQRVFSALQEGFVVAIIQAVSRIFSLVLLFVVVFMKMGLPALVYIVGGLSNTVLLSFGAFVLLREHKWLRLEGVSIRAIFDLSVLRGIFKIGFLGLGAAIAIYFVNSSPAFIMARKYGAAGVVDFAVLMKLISIPGMLLTYILLPLWPAITEAKTRGDNEWIKKTYHRCVRATVILSVFSFVGLVILGREIIYLWTRNRDVVPAFELVVACGIFMVLGYWNTMASLILNGVSRYKGQATYGLLLAVIAAYIANCLPESSHKELIVWVVVVGYMIRCVLMQIEVGRVIGVNWKVK